MQVSQPDIEAMLADVYRTDRIFPGHLEAMEILNSRDYQQDVVRQIVIPLSSVALPGVDGQFLRDFEVYGLYEAIVYLHDLDLGPDPNSLLADIVRCYVDVSEAYRLARAELHESDDPRICDILDAMHDYGTGGSHNYSHGHTPLVPPTEEESAREEATLASSMVEAPPDRTLAALLTGLVKEPLLATAKRADEAAVDAIGAEWMFHDAPSTADMPFRLAEAIAAYSIHPLGPAGLQIMEQILELARSEAFGDYERWINCSECHIEFSVGELQVDTFVATLTAGRWLCESCRASGG